MIPKTVSGTSTKTHNLPHGAIMHAIILSIALGSNPAATPDLPPALQALSSPAEVCTQDWATRIIGGKAAIGTGGSSPFPGLSSATCNPSIAKTVAKSAIRCWTPTAK